MSKKALLVGINNFINASWQLRGCVNDTLAMQEILKTYFSFVDGDIRILHDREATGQGIREGLQWLLSGYADASKDVRIFHFSSRGTQVGDQSRTTVECWNNVIMSHDHDWNNPFWVSDLQTIFDTIPAGVNFTFITDCCYSGSIQKSLFDSGVESSTRYLPSPLEVPERIAELQAQRDIEAEARMAAQLMQMLQGIPQDQWEAKKQEYCDSLLSRFREKRYAAYAVVSVERHVLLAACEEGQTAADARIEGVTTEGPSPGRCARRSGRLAVT